MKADLLARLMAAREAKRPVALITRLPEGAQSLFDEGVPAGELSLGEEALAEIRTLLARGKSATLSSDTHLFVRTYIPAPRLVIVGAVHITQALAPMATLAGFEVTVIDPRRAFASAERFPEVRLTDEWPDEAIERIGLDAATAVVTLTHDPKLDDPALEAALRSPAFYIGALGSTRTHARRVERLRESGLGELAGRIRAPVGLDLGGRSPAEIAVAILAEIIQTRHRGGGAR